LLGDVVDEKHPAMIECFTNFATLMRLKKKFSESLKYHEQALSIAYKVYGEVSQKVAD